MKKIYLVLIIFVPCLSFAQWTASGTNIYNTNSGSVGIGTISPSHRLTVQGTFALFGSGLDGSTYQRFALYCDTQYGLLFETPLNASSSRQNIKFNWRGGGIPPFFIQGSSANVGIGTTTPDYKLTVNGKIKAEEIQVVVDVPADYVFEKEYDLMPMTEVEKFVNENKHLPGMPDAQSLITNGWQVGEMNNKLLEKVEELTLYLIEMKKEIDQLNKENKELKMVIQKD